MKVLSVNVGMPREIEWNGRTVETGIFKSPVSGPVMMRSLNFDGDRQADLTVHGGTEKAVYAYPSEHYAYWCDKLERNDLPPGSFGENLTTEGLDEETVCVGDRYRIGQSVVVVTQPRVPCYKLEAKFAPTEIVKRFLKSGYSGFYFAVLQEGLVAGGDAIALTDPDPLRVSIADLNRIFRREVASEEALRRALEVQALAEPWREMLTEMLGRRRHG